MRVDPCLPGLLTYVVVGGVGEGVVVERELEWRTRCLNLAAVKRDDDRLRGAAHGKQHQLRGDFCCS